MSQPLRPTDGDGSEPGFRTGLNPISAHLPPSYGYDRSYWFACGAHAALMTSMSVLFRYADFIACLVGPGGHVEGHLGWIVGVGMVGALVMRGVQGVAIDRYGPRRIWLVSLLLLVASLVGHLAIRQVDTPPIYLLRMLMMTGLAGAFGSAITFISLRAPLARMPEMIGVMGSSGFLGWVLGPILGDVLFSHGPPNHAQVARMFLLAAGAVVISLALAAVASRREVRPVAEPRPSLISLIRAYHPGPILLVAIAMGMGVGLPHTFLRAYTAYLHIDRITTFFVVYAITAFAVRILTRRFPEVIGIRAMNLLGLAAMAGSMLLFLPVTREWMLAWPAMAGGTAHGLLFPAVVGGGSGMFPREFRGTGTVLMLAMFDVGSLFGQPSAGSIIEAARYCGLPPYTALFLVVAAVLTAVAGWYALATRRPATPPGLRPIGGGNGRAERD